MGEDGVELSCPGSSVVADPEGEAARFENAPIPETIGRNLVSPILSQSFTEESERGTD